MSAQEATENAIDLIAQSVARLGKTTRRMVALAATLGRRFSAADLAALTQRPVSTVERGLINACRAQILVKHDDGYGFSHDRIQESAYALIPDAERPQWHLRVARLLAQRHLTETTTPPLFEIVSHLNRAAGLLIEPAEREQAVRLHLSAGRKAKAAAAFPAAFNYLANGLALLGPEPWRQHYELSLALHSEAAEAAYLSADFPTAERLATSIHAHAKMPIERIPAFETQALMAYAHHQVPEAIAIYLEALSRLGLTLPIAPTTEVVKVAVIRIKRRLEAELNTNLQPLHSLTDPTGATILRLLAAMAHTAAWSHLALLRLSVCKLVELTLAHGYGPQAPFGFILFGMTLCDLLEDLEGGERIAAFGLSLLDSGASQGIKALCQGIYSAFIQGYRTHPALLAETFTDLYRPALESGDLRAAGGALYQRSVLSFVGGVALAEVEQTIRHALEAMSKSGQQLFASTLQRLLELTWALQSGDEAKPVLPTSPAASPPDLDMAVRVMGPELMVRHLFRQHQAALEAALASEVLPQELFPAIPLDFYRCLIFLDRHPLSTTQREHSLDKAAGYRQRLRARARAAPGLYQHKVDLVEAEWRRAQGRIEEALGYYAKAIEGAHRHGFVHEEAIAHELTAECYLEAEQPSLAALHLQAAASAYGRWGARAKLQQLYRHYPALLSQTSLPLIGLSPERHQDLTQEIESRRHIEESLRQALAEVSRLKTQLEAEHAYLQEEVKGAYDFEEIIGHSEALRRVLHQVEQVAATDASVLLLGETGTGKELIARAIHSRSPRKDRPLIKVNCAALPAPLIESELFGHEKGAFTGALTRKIGRFELADGGTLFLDEIGDLPLELQAKLLRVLQEGEFERLGSPRTVKVNARVISATNRELARAVTDGSFRSDLYYRLGVFPIHVPPLRERREDIPLLVWYFITTCQGRLGKTIEQVPKAVMEALTNYAWPGNVRELGNVIERAMILSPGPILALEPALGTIYSAPAERRAVADNLAAVERAHILNVLAQCHGRIKGVGNAAERLGLHPNTLRSRMKKLGIGRP
ncbi:MAG: sigma 54-interacting transcriptional regulator [Candidatus Competibacteraceae bacterium]